MLAFLNPNKIHESVLYEGGEHINDDEFDFLNDEMEYVLAIILNSRY